MALTVHTGSTVGQGSIPAGLPGGAGSPGGPAAPNQGAGWEIAVLGAPAFGELLAVIPNHLLLTFQFAKQLKDLGSGTVTLDLDDSWWTTVTLPNNQPAHYLLDWEHVWRIYQDGVPRFEFLGETITEQLADSSEQRTVTITGPGTIATLKWAMAAPEGFPSNITYKLDAVTDGFDETDVNGNLVLDTGLWNASAPSSHLSLNPSGTCRVMASPGGTVLGSTAYDGTGTLVSANITPITSPDPAGASLDGSELTQMYIVSTANSSYYALFGLSATTFYTQFGGPSGVFTHTIASATAFAASQQANNDYAYWQIAEQGGTFFFYTSPDGQNWTKQWSIAHGWDATSVGLYFAAKYDTDNKEYASVTGINSNVTTSSLGGPLYYSQAIIGGVWLDLLAKAQARGTVPFVTTGQLGSSTDSFGNPWADVQSVQIANGTDLYTLLGAHASMINADWIMQPGFLLQVGIPETGKITLGTDRSKQVIFRDGMDCAARVRTRARDQIANLYAVVNADGRTITATDSTSAGEYGQRESWLQAAMQVTPADLEAVATAADLQTATEVLSWTLRVTPFIPGRDIFNSYDVGDWVGLERPDFTAVDAVRVVAIAVQVAADGTETHELTLNSYIQWLDEQLNYIQNKLGGGLINVSGTTAIPSSITNQNAPSVFSLTLGSLGDVAGSPGGNNPLVYDPVTGQWVPAGSINPVTSGNVPLSMGGSGGTVTISGDGSNVSVQGAGGTVILGTQSDGTVTTTVQADLPPATPDTPVVVDGMGSLAIGWDGLLGGVNPLLNFLYVQVHLSTTSGFTPGSSTLQGVLHSGGLYTVTGLTAGTTYYAKLVAVNQAGLTSSASAQASGVPAAGGSGVQVTISATAPSSPNTGDLWFDANNGYELKQWNGTAWTAYQFGTNAIAAGSVTAALIAANTITAAQIQAGAITATLLAANAVTAGKVAAGAIDGMTITGAVIVADGTSGNVLVYSGTPASGNLFCAVSPSGGSDGFGNSFNQGITLIGISGLTDLFSVVDTSGNTLANVDNAGNISGQTINASVDLQVGGQSVSALLDNGPLGLVNYGFQSLSSAFPSTAIGTTEAAIAELDQAVTGGRVYDVVMNPTILSCNTSGSECRLKLRFTTDGTTPTTSSSLATEVDARAPAASTAFNHPGLRCPFFPTATGTYKFLLTGICSSGTFQFSSNDQYLRLEVYDVGTFPQANNLTVFNSGGSSGSSSPQQYTETFYPLHTYSYYSSTGLRNTDGNMYHGAYSGESDYQFAYIEWNTGSRGNSLQTALGYSVNWFHLRLTNQHSWYANGMTWGLHYSTTQGGGVGTYSALLTSAFISNGNTFDYNLGSYYTNLAGPNWTVLGPDSADEHNLNWYGYFYGGGGSDTYMPRVNVNYTH